MEGSRRKRSQILDESGIKKKPKICAIPLKLVDIPNDCLETIFEMLDIGDLVNVAEADDKFTPAAESVFSRRHGMKRVTSTKDSMSHIYKDVINVETDSMVACLCHFGQFISNLTIDFNFEPLTDIERAIHKYCRKPLINLSLECGYEQLFETLNDPFVNVQSLSIQSSTINANLSHLSRWFPNLVRLDLIYVKTPEAESIEVNFQHLERVNIHNHMDASLSTILKIISLNPQIKSLELSSYYSQQLMETLNNNSEQLQEISLYTPIDGFRSLSKQTFHLGSATKFTLHCQSTQFIVYHLNSANYESSN